MRRNVQYIVVTQHNSVYVPDKPCHRKGIMVSETTPGGFAAIYVQIYVYQYRTAFLFKVYISDHTVIVKTNNQLGTFEWPAS